MGPLQDQSSQDTFYCDEHLSLDFDRHRAMLDSQALPLTRKEYNLLALLVEHSGRIVPREALLMLIWGYGPGIRTRTLDVHIGRLRRNWGRTQSSTSKQSSGSGTAFSRSRRRRSKASGSSWPPSLREHYPR